MAPRPTHRSTLSKKHVARLERERRQTRWIVGIAAAIVVIVIGLLSYSVLSDKVLKPRKAVARVGEDKITLAQFQARVRLQRSQLINQYSMYSQYAQMFGMDFTSQLQQYESQLSEMGAEQLGQGVLDQMINEKLMIQAAAKDGITVSEQEIQNRLQDIFNYYPDGKPTATVTPTDVTLPTISPAEAAIVTITPTPGPTDAATPTATATLAATSTATIAPTLDLTTTATPTLEPTATPEPSATPTATATASPTLTPTPASTATPEPTATPVSKESFETSLTESKDSFAKLGFTDADYRNLVLTELVRTKMFDYVTRDMKPFEDQVWARHILVADEATANSIRERLLKGEDFAALAAEFSTDTSNKDSGGDLGWFGKGQMVAPFEEAAFALKPGEFSQPVQTSSGWHIIQVIGHETRPLTADQFDQARQNAFNQWMQDLRTQAEADGLIETFDFWKANVPLEPNLQSATPQ